MPPLQASPRACRLQLKKGANMPVELRKVLGTIPVYRPGESPDECEIDNAFKLSSNESPWEPPASVIAAIERAAMTLNRYPDYYEVDLCESLGVYLGFEPEWICVDNGSGTLLQDLVRIVCDADDEVLYCTPTFAAYEIDVKLAGAKPVTCPLDSSYTFDLDAMLAAITPKTRMILICNPNNPTGTYLAADAIGAFVSRVPNDVLVVIDEAYHDFERKEALDASLALPRSHDNVVLLRTFSKAFGLAGMRIGYCIAAPYLIDAINKTVAEFSVSTPAQAAALACLKPATLKVIERRVEEIVENRELLEKGLEQAEISFIPSSSNFVMLPCEENMALFNALKSRGIITRPFDSPRGIRITIGTLEQMKLVAEALGFTLPEE